MRSLTLAAALVALLPGLSQAQIGIWAPLSLPVLFGQETPRPTAEAPAALPTGIDFDFDVNTQAVRPNLPEGLTPWTPPMPTPTRECRDLKELVEASWGLFNRPNNTTGTHVAVFQTSVPAQCNTNGACCPLVAAIVRDCLTSSSCPIVFRPYTMVGKIAMSFCDASSQCPTSCGQPCPGQPAAGNVNAVATCPTGASSQPPHKGFIRFGIHLKKNDVNGAEAARAIIGAVCNTEAGTTGCCTQERTTTQTFAFGPFRLEIGVNGAKPVNAWVYDTPAAIECCAEKCETPKGCCKSTGATCVTGCATKANVAGTTGCPGEVCAQVRVRTVSSDCVCNPAAAKSCCPEGACCCVKKVVADKKCGCGKECGCCACKKTVQLTERLERLLSRLEGAQRGHAEAMCPIMGGMPMLPPGMVMPPITVTLPPPPGMPTDSSLRYPPVVMPHPGFVMTPPPMPLLPPHAYDRIVHVRSASASSVSGAVKLQTPLFDAQCDSLTSGPNADEVILEGNVRVSCKRTSSQLNAARVVINTRTGAIRAEKSSGYTSPASTPSYPAPAPSSGPFGVDHPGVPSPYYRPTGYEQVSPAYSPPVGFPMPYAPSR